MTSTASEFLSLMGELAENAEYEWSMRELVHMQEVGTNKPALDADGNQIIHDVLKFGDARIDIERDDNDPSSVQTLITFLSELGDHLPELIEAYRSWLAAADIPF